MCILNNKYLKSTSSALHIRAEESHVNAYRCVLPEDGPLHKPGHDDLKRLLSRPLSSKTKHEIQQIFKIKLNFPISDVQGILNASHLPTLIIANNYVPTQVQKTLVYVVYCMDNNEC